MSTRAAVLRAVLWLACAAPAPTAALMVGNLPPDDFVARSKADPGRLYALLVGATWCGPCKHLAAQLAAVAPSSPTALARAAWDRVEVDEYGTERFQAFEGRVEASDRDGIPFVLVFRGGKTLGISASGDYLDGIAAFLAEAEARPAGRPMGRLPDLLCRGRADGASFTFGISGPHSRDDHSTDRFGVENLLAFGGKSEAGRSLLFAPSTGTARATQASRSGWGAFYVGDPIAPLTGLISTTGLSTMTVAGLPDMPGRSLRLVLTGHGAPQGMPLDAASDVFLTEPELTEAVRAARRRGKVVRGLVLTCFGGQFGDSFMPSPGDRAAACAAFSTLPEKEAEGCYSESDVGDERDYATTASRNLACGPGSDGRRRHYQVVLSTVSRDVPMLSSEYFLLYGPGAAYLGRAPRAPMPVRGMADYELGGGLKVVVGLIDGRVLAVSRGEKSLPIPQVSVVDCRPHPDAYSGLDFEHSVGAFFLRGRVSGAGAVQRSDCSPVLNLHWNPEDGVELPDQELDLGSFGLDYSPTDPYWGKYLSGVFPDGVPTVHTRGLKREARVLLTTVLPEFSGKIVGAALQGKIDALSARLRPVDAPLADALAALASIARRDARARALKIKSMSVSPTLSIAPIDFGAEVAVSSTATTEKKSADEEVEEGSFNSDALQRAFWRNIGPGEYDSIDGISLFRLAHLVAAAEAELALRAQGRTSPRARRLVKQLDELQDCEKGLY